MGYRQKLWLSVGVFCLTLGFSTNLFGEDCPQWRGVNRDGVYRETGLLKSWPKEGPKMVWSQDSVGNGYSSPVVVKGKVYITGEKSRREYLSAFDLQGKQLWQTEYGKAWSGRFEPARTTPTVVDGMIYVISGGGEVVCLDANTGKIKWTVDGIGKFEGETGTWGTCESPLVVDDKVIYTPGGNQTTMVALNKKDGSVIWKSPSLNDKGAYVSPLLITWGGKRQILSVISKYVFSVDVEKGHILWKVDYSEYGGSRRWMINTNTPLFKDGRIFVTSGYDHGAIMVEVSKDGTSAKCLGETPDLDTHHGGVVLVNGNLYGSNWINNSQGNWVCLDWNTGEKKYETTWGSKGSIIYADGMLYCYEERRGTLGLVKATPEGFKVVSSFRITKGNHQHWAHPVISDGKLYLRHGRVLMVFDIKKK